MDEIAAPADLAELCARVKEQREQLELLAARLDEMASREAELQNQLTRLSEALLARHDEIEALLHTQHLYLEALLPANGAPDRAAVATAEPVSDTAKAAGYQNLLSRIREVVNKALPLDATILVVSKGDDELVKLAGRKAWHFPQESDGRYAGFHPANSAAAITHLEALQARGAQFLLFPKTALWWLDHYREFKQLLDTQHRRVINQKDVCVVYALRQAKRGGAAVERNPYKQSAAQIREIVANLLPPDATVLVVSKGDEDLLKLGAERKGWHFPQDENAVYLGYYPADSAEAITHLEALREKGGQFLLFPNFAFWWLEHYRELKNHLHSRYRLVSNQKNLCQIYALTERSGKTGSVKGRLRQSPPSNAT
jgi:hypothetical protein